MDTVHKVVDAASKAIWGETTDQQKGQQAEEPVSGAQGKGTATDPYDGGNREEQPGAPRITENTGPKTKSASTSTEDEPASKTPADESAPKSASGSKKGGEDGKQGNPKPEEDNSNNKTKKEDKAAIDSKSQSNKDQKDEESSRRGNRKEDSKSGKGESTESKKKSEDDDIEYSDEPAHVSEEALKGPKGEPVIPEFEPNDRGADSEGKVGDEQGKKDKQKQASAAEGDSGGEGDHKKHGLGSKMKEKLHLGK